MEAAMELRHLRYFIAVAKVGSLTVAACIRRSLRSVARSVILNMRSAFSSESQRYLAGFRSIGLGSVDKVHDLCGDAVLGNLKGFQCPLVSFPTGVVMAALGVRSGNLAQAGQVSLA